MAASARNLKVSKSATASIGGASGDISGPSSAGLSVPESFEFASKDPSALQTIPTDLDEPLSDFLDEAPKTSKEHAKLLQKKKTTEEGNSSKRTVDNYYLNQVMAELGWSEYIEAPLPNESNLSIVDEMSKTSKKIEKINKNMVVIDEDIARDLEDLKKVREALNQERELAEAQSSGVEAEKQHKLLLQNQLATCRHKIAEHVRGIQEAKEICEMWENMRRVNLARTKERERAAIDEQTNLESYSDRILMIDEMSCTLQKYFRVDVEQAGAKEREIAKLKMVILELNKKMEAERGNTAELHAALDIEAEKFRRLIEERQNLIEQWCVTIERQKQRDVDIAHRREQLDEAKTEVEKKEEIMEKQITFNDHVKDTNEEKMRDLDAKEREKARLCQEKRTLDTDIDEIYRQSAALQRNVSSLASQLNKVRENIHCLKTEYKNCEAWQAHLKATNEILKLELDSVKNGELNAEDRLRQMDEEYGKMEELNEEQLKQWQERNEEKFHTHNQLIQMTQEEKQKEVEIEGLIKVSRGLDRRNDKYDVQLLHLQDRFVSLEFDVQRLQTRIMEMTSQKMDQAQDDATARKILMLKANLEKLNEKLRKYDKEIKNQRSEMKLVKQDYEKSKELEENFTIERDHQDFYIENAVRILGNTIRRKEELLKDFCFHKVKLSAVEKLVKSSKEKKNEKEDKLDYVANLKDEMTLLMQLTSEQNSYEIRLLKDENSTIRKNIAEAKLKLEQRKKIHETELAKTPEHDQSQLISEAARVRAQLMQEGDKLDKDVRRAEKELRALMNSFNMIELENSALKAKYEGKTVVQKESEPKQSLSELKQQLVDLRKQISYKKNLIAELSREREQNLEVIQDVEREIEKQEALMYEKNISITKIHAEQKTSVEKLNRAKLSVVRSVKGIDKDSDGFKDVGLRYGRIRLQGLVQDVMRALREHPNELEIAKNYLKSDNIDIPNND